MDPTNATPPAPGARDPAGPAPGATGRGLLVVDVQVDFCEGGALAVQGGAAVAGRIGRLLAAEREARRRGEGRYDVVVASLDWHVDPAGHFAAEPDYRDTWPPHCLAFSPGAAFHPELAAGAGAPVVTVVDTVVTKGSDQPAYSAFQGSAPDGRSLEAVLRDAGVRELDVVGIATSHCVAASALDAAAAGFDVTVLTDLAVGVTPEMAAEALDRLAAHGVHLATSGVDAPA